MRVRICGATLVMFLLCASVRGQEAYSPKHSWTVLAEYAPISGHYVPDGGEAWNRKLVSVGGGSTWKLHDFWGGSLSYVAEFKPVLLLNDPTQTVKEISSAGTTVVTTRLGRGQICTPANVTYAGSGTVTQFITTCGSQWTYGQEFSPVGVKYAFGIRHRLQPAVMVVGGYQYTDRPVPVDDTGNFNFTIAFGAGFTYYIRPGRAVSLEARVRHFSNAYTAQENVGTDLIVLHAAYSFDHFSLKP